MAETAIAAVLSKFGELAASEAKILLEVGDNMELLRDRLEWLQAFIRDADRKRRAGTDQLTRVWVRQTRDVAFEAEDTIDEFVYQVDLKSQGYRRWKKMWRKYTIGFWTQIVSRHVLSTRIKRINTRLAKISENQKEYNIGHTPLAPMTSSATDATSAWSDDVVGFDNHLTMLRDLVLDKDHPRLMFISILGESGVGKRTLVHMIGEELRVNKYRRVFEIPKWLKKLDKKIIYSEFEICFRLGVPADSTVDVVLAYIYMFGLDCLNQQEEEGTNDIIEKVRNLFAGKRYMVIIDGIASKTMLNCLRASLPDDNNGSRVLLVFDTENEDLAWHANSMNQNKFFNGIHMLNRLDEKRSGKLFCSRAFRRIYDDELKKEDMMMTNKIVYDITGGYPLAIVVLAGLLRFKERPGQWEAVLQQLRPSGPRSMAEALLVQGGGSISEGNQQIIEANNLVSLSKRTTTIERVFWASFEDLPNDLKSCFLYFVALPKNTVWPSNDIVRVWIAEGFIKPEKGKTMEELGHNYLKELVLRCLFQIQGMNVAGGIEQVYVHKRLHGFLQSEAREAGFMEVHNMHHVFVPPSVRRLSFTSLGGRYTTLITSKFPKLRSFHCWVVEEQHKGTNYTQDKNKKQQHEGTNDRQDEDRHKGTNDRQDVEQHNGTNDRRDKNKKQQHVDTNDRQDEEQHRQSGNGGIHKDDVGKKHCHDLKFLRGSKFLRVIQVKGLRIKKLPNWIGEMIHLRYLSVSYCYLKEHPSSIKRLLNLQTLDIRGTQVEVIDPGFWKIRTLCHVLAENLTLPETIEEELGELQTLSGVQPAAQGQGGE